jgi:iron complex transport system ATP-binding protein
MSSGSAASGGATASRGPEAGVAGDNCGPGGAPGGIGAQVRKLHFGYPGTRLFEGLSVNISPGELVGLIGANGSGKTTLLRLISGVLAPRGGEVIVGNREVAAIPARERARMIGVVPQESGLTFDFSALEVVLMGRAAHWGLLGVESARDRTAVRRAMERTGTLPFAGRLIGRLSGGERQLVFVARALAQEPGFLLLDEPTAFLDIRHRLEVYKVLEDLNGSEGLTVLITSHDINLAARFCPRLILMKAGRVIAEGPTSEVFREEILSEVYDTRLRVLRDSESGDMLAVPDRRT